MGIQEDEILAIQFLEEKLKYTKVGGLLHLLLSGLKLLYITAPSGDSWFLGVDQ